MNLIEILRSQKFISALLLISVIVIIAGVLLKNYSEQQLTPNTNEQATIESMQNIARQAADQLEQTRNLDATSPIKDVKPQLYADRVAALNGETPELGSEDWCALMMIKDADAWSEAEQQLFAQRCL